MHRIASSSRVPTKISLGRPQPAGGTLTNRSPANYRTHRLTDRSQSMIVHGQIAIQGAGQPAGKSEFDKTNRWE
jgi:hypothetical protein